MSDYRDPNDPMYGYEPADRTGIWGYLGMAYRLCCVPGGYPRPGLGLGRATCANPCRVE
jgi:hypothetical protein